MIERLNDLKIERSINTSFGLFTFDFDFYLYQNFRHEPKTDFTAFPCFATYRIKSAFFFSGNGGALLQQRILSAFGKNFENCVGKNSVFCGWSYLFHRHFLFAAMVLETTKNMENSLEIKSFIAFGICIVVLFFLQPTLGHQLFADSDVWKTENRTRIHSERVNWFH